MSRPPSQAVIEAVEQVMCRLVHGEDWTAPIALPESSEPRHRVAACYSCQRNAAEVARAAEAAALKVAAAALDEHDAEVRPTFAAADRLLASPAVHPYTVLEAEKWLRARADRIEAGRDED